jgi:protein O-GlcNAc transferase
VRGEAGIGRERNILVPILFEQVEPPIAFRSLHTENLTDWDGEPDAPDFLKLCKAINERIKSKTAPSASSTPSNTALNKAIGSAKSNSLKRLFSNMWDWLSVTKHQQTMAFIGGGLSIAIAGGWQAYQYVTNKPAETRPNISVSDDGIANTGNMTVTASNGGNAVNFVGNNNTIGDLNASANIKEIVKTLAHKHQLDLQAKDDQIKALTEAVTALSKGQGVLGTEAQIKAAFVTLAQGDPDQAKALFANVAQKGEQQAKQTAEAYRHLGALAFLNNTQEALYAYRRATEIDPDNAEGWSMLGQLLERVGDTNGAIADYFYVKELGEKHHDIYEISWAYQHLGSIYRDRGDLDKALVYHQKYLKLGENLGDKGYLATAYTNLGYDYETLGDLDLALELQQKALTLNEGLGDKEGMIASYANFGFIYQLRGEWRKSLKYFLKCLALVETLVSEEREEGMAGVYTNLGDIYLGLGDLDKALEIYQKALAFHKRLGDKELIADGYGAWVMFI